MKAIKKESPPNAAIKTIDPIQTIVSDKPTPSSTQLPTSSINHPQLLFGHHIALHLLGFGVDEEDVIRCKELT